MIMKIGDRKIFFAGTFEMEYERPLREHMSVFPKANRITVAASRKRATRYHWLLLERKS